MTAAGGPGRAAPKRRFWTGVSTRPRPELRIESVLLTGVRSTAAHLSTGLVLVGRRHPGDLGHQLLGHFDVTNDRG